MAKDTKERILKAAVKKFSEKGYEGTNIRELSAALGLSKAAFYKHYESKEEIWELVLKEMTAYYEERFGSSNHLPTIPESTEELYTLTMRMLDFTLHDEKIIMVRKILLTEQFRDERVRALATEHFNIGLESLFTNIFAGMISKGILKQDEPEMLAFAYTAPISTLVHYCDREPEKEPEIMAKIESFIRHFIQTYEA